MIKINYTLDVDMDTEKRKYHPSEKLSGGLKNIFRLRGPNSSGKSTFMNIVALGSHGLHRGKVPDSVKDRMKDLLESEHKDLEFELIIHDPVTDTVLKSKKEKNYPDIKVSESLDGGETYSLITPETFERKYNLIYDIPENPVGRLNDLVGEIKEVQDNSYKKTRDLQEYVEKVSAQISSSRSDADIKRMKNDLEKYKSELEKIDISDEKIRNEALKGLMMSLKLEELKSKSDDSKRAYDNFKKEVKGKKGSSSDIKNHMTNLNKKIQNMLNIRMSFLINANRIQYSKYNQLKKQMEKLERDPDTYIRQKRIPEEIKQEVINIKLFAKSIKTSDDDQELKLISELIRLLEPHRDKNLNLPEIGPLNKFYKILTEQFNQMNSAYDKKMVDNIIVNADNILELMEEIDIIISKMPPSDNDPVASFEDSSKKERLKSSYDVANRSVKNYVRDISGKEGITLANLKKKISEFNILTNNEFSDKKYDDVRKIYEEQNKKYNEKESEMEGIKHNINRLERNINAEEEKGESDFLEHKDDINRLKDEIHKTVLLLNEAGRKLYAIENKKYSNHDKNDPFFESVWKYLGKRLRVIRHEHKEYPASKVNLIDGIIVAEDGTKIHMSDMGTGQSQLSYLKGLLSADDNRKIIALFDEVSTMTDSTLNVLLDEFQDLQKKGKLMMGMTVSPAEEIEVEEYGI